MRKFALLIVLALPFAAAAPAEASPQARFGIQDDAWLLYGPGTLDDRLDTLDRLGVDVVRWTIRWDQVAKQRPTSPRLAGDPAYDWSMSDDVLAGLRRRGIGAVVSLLGTPRWANGGRAWQVAPTRGADFADFAVATARRYPWVRDWTVWNEPNQRRWLSPVSARTYVVRLLNPAYGALKGVNRSNRVAGGVTAPRGNAGGMSPVDFIRAHARGAGAARRLRAPSRIRHGPAPRRRRAAAAPTARRSRWRRSTGS